MGFFDFLRPSGNVHFNGDAYGLNPLIQRVRAGERMRMERDSTEDLQRYVETAGVALLDAMSVYDLATASSRMMSFDCLGDDNDAWREGPFLNAGAGEAQIDRTRPYCLMVSKELSVSLTLVLGPRTRGTDQNGVRLPMSKGSSSEKTIAKLIIIEQFEIFKDFWRKHDGPYNAKQVKKWRGRGFDEVIERIQILTERRNELVHGDRCEPPSIREAVEFYYGLRTASEQLAGAPPTTAEALRSLMP